LDRGACANMPAEPWYVDFVAGTAGGFAGKLIDYPFDTVKVLQQTQTAGPRGTTVAPRYSGALDCLRVTVRAKGFFGLYKGLSAPLVGSMAENAVLFAAYGFFQKQLLRARQGEQQGGGHGEHAPLSIFDLALAGAAAGGVVSFVLNPVELIKCRLQVQQSAGGRAGGRDNSFRAYKGPLDCLVKTVKAEGVAGGLFRGNCATLMREVPGNFAWFGVYELVCASQVPAGGTRAELPPAVSAVAGAASGVAYWTAFYPADTIKSQIQTDPALARQGIAATGRRIWERGGLRGLYAGWGVTMLRAAPENGAIFLCYEQVARYLRDGAAVGEQ
jgi:hypothetical protein